MPKIETPETVLEIEAFEALVGAFVVNKLWRNKTSKLLTAGVYKSVNVW